MSGVCGAAIVATFLAVLALLGAHEPAPVARPGLAPTTTTVASR